MSTLLLLITYGFRLTAGRKANFYRDVLARRTPGGAAREICPIIAMIDNLRVPTLTGVSQVQGRPDLLIGMIERLANID